LGLCSAPIGRHSVQAPVLTLPVLGKRVRGAKLSGVLQRQPIRESDDQTKTDQAANPDRPRRTDRGQRATRNVNLLVAVFEPTSA
jgi:hypothetical protein